MVMVSESTIRLILKKSKYELIEEFTIQIESELENDAIRIEQSTIQVSQIGGTPEPEPEEHYHLQQQ
jgi:hypothetical protein